MVDMLRERGDTWPALATFTRSDGSARDITGCTFLMTVNKVARPTDTADQLFESAGSILGDPLNGQATFPVVIIPPGKYFYNIQLTEADGVTIRTPLSGAYVVLQDITKAEFDMTLLLDDFGVDGTKIEADGVGSAWVTEWFSSLNDPASNLTAETRDGRRVVRFYHPAGHTGLHPPNVDPPARLYMAGDTVPVILNPGVANIEITLLVYINKTNASIQLIGAAGQDNWYEVSSKHASGTGVTTLAGGYANVVEDTSPSFLIDTAPAEATHVAGWYYIKMLMERGMSSLKGKHWPEGDAEPASWMASITPVAQMSGPFNLLLSGLFYEPIAGDEVLEPAQIRLRSWK
jgi:hypothetical protein